MVILLQETHCTRELENLWQAEWGGKVFYSHGTSSARGVATLVKKKYSFQCC